MAGSSRPGSREDFEIAIICALRTECDAVEGLFDEFWEEDDSYGKAPGDPNAYTTGRIGIHNVVLAFMPNMGKAASASVAASFRSSFPRIKLGLVVGICGGSPTGTDDEKEILLGDVIISTGLVQFDFGRQFSNKVVRKDTLLDSLGRPNSEIRSFLVKMAGLRGRTQLRKKTAEHLKELLKKEGFEASNYPGAHNDKLYRPTYRHKHHGLTDCTICVKCNNKEDDVCADAIDSSCVELGCDDNEQVPRDRLQKAQMAAVSGSATAPEGVTGAHIPLIHFGLIASGDLVMKSGYHRDEIAATEKVIAFEMEGAGVWDNFPTVVIKGVCDYADSHKNKKWQKYAAAVAAACMKAFLEEWRIVVQRLPRTQSEARESSSHGGVAFYGPVSGTYVIPGTQVMGGTVNFNFNEGTK